MHEFYYSFARVWEACYTGRMKKHSAILLVSTALALSGCGASGKQWLDPDKTFATQPQPDIKGINDTQEEMAKEATAAGDFARASKFYELLVGSDKGTKEQKLRYKLGLANTMRRLGENERALAMYEQLARENPDNMDAAEGRGLALMANGKSVDASRVFSDIVAKDPTRWRTLNALGILFVTKNMIPEAMAYYNEALKQSPENPALYNNIGLSYAVGKEYNRGVEALEQAGHYSKTPSQRKQIDLNMALVYGAAGDLDHAREIASKYFDGPALDNNMGLYAHLSKNDGLAKTYLNMALSQSPTFYERAWSNLDIVNDSNSDAGAPVAPPNPSLPKLTQ